MAISNVSIANMALSHVGASSTIESLTEASAEARQCNLWFDYSRKQVLESFDWNFARRRLALAVHEDDPPDEWAFRYQYPSDCVVARRIPHPVDATEDAIPFTVETDDTGATKSILCSLEDAVLVYTFDNVVPELYSSLFVEVLSHTLASHIAFALTGKREIKNDEIKIAQQLLATAPAHNANEQMPERSREAEWIRGR